MMKLHRDSDAFRVLLEALSDASGLRIDVLEKDYYVTLVLQELSELQRQGLRAYFKGGTALYKALHSIRRFSEDIDLSVDATGLTRSQIDKVLRKATKEYASCTRNHARDATFRSAVIAEYNYTPLLAYDLEDSLQRFGKIKVEATSFTIAEPFAPLLVAPMLYDLAEETQRRVLLDTYEVSPFTVLTMTLERIFVDKLFAAEAYVRRAASTSSAFDAAKHIYDLCVLVQLPLIHSLAMNEEALQSLVRVRLKEEMNRLDGIPGVNTRDFTFFTDAFAKQSIRAAYERMQSIYVFRDCDIIPVDEAIQALMRLEAMLGEPFKSIQQ